MSAFSNTELPPNLSNGQSLCMLIGENVQRLRVEQQLSKKKLAYISGVSRPLLDKVERGEADLRASYISRIADSLSVSPVELLTPPQ